MILFNLATFVNNHLCLKIKLTSSFFRSFIFHSTSASCTRSRWYITVVKAACTESGRRFIENLDNPVLNIGRKRGLNQPTLPLYGESAISLKSLWYHLWTFAIHHVAFSRLLTNCYVVLFGICELDYNKVTPQITLLRSDSVSTYPIRPYAHRLTLIAIQG